MEERLLHVFRNTPLGRETLLQSIYFCKTLDISMQIYVPQATQFLMYFDHDAVQVDLDSSYLIAQDTAVSHATSLANERGLKPGFLTPKNFTASQLPDIPSNFNYMCCPRSISDLTSKIGLGYIGPKVRRIVKSSTFPVLLTSAAYKEWKSLTVFYGGSENANRALSWGLHLSRISGFPLDMFTFAEGHSEGYIDQQLDAAGLKNQVQDHVRHWFRQSGGKIEDHLNKVPHDALLVVGAFGHGLIKDFLFGSKMETIQTWMPNSILLVGPNCVFRGA
ncbi:MAG: universal stress protein [Desulfobacteraceae bacterium]|jgi:nucleotide-binding universal stress UspA family protein